jgi:hypothetical protein
MGDAPTLAQQAQQKTNAAVAANSGPVRSFVASDPAKAAAVQYDYAPLANLGQRVQDWWNTGGPVGDIKRAFASASQGYDAEKAASAQALAQGDVLGYLKHSGLEFLNVVGGLASPFAAVQEPIARGLQFIPQSTYSEVLAQRGQPQAAPLTREQSEANSQVLSGILTGLLPMPKVGVGRLLERRPPPIDLGEATVVRPPALPGPGGIEAPLEAEFADIHPTTSPGAAQLHASIADMDAAHVEQMQAAVEDTATHARAPELVQDFLENHTLAHGQEVTVPTDAISKLWDEGHEVFAARSLEIQQALVSGGDVRVPLSEYLAETSGQPFAQELNSVTRFREGGVSQEEAKEIRPYQEVGTGAPAGESGQIAARIPEDLAAPGTAEVVAPIAARASEAVQQVFREMGIDQLFQNAKALGLTKGQMERYGGMLEEAQAAIHDRILQRTYTQLRRERTPEWKAEVERRAGPIAEQLNALPSIRAMRELSQTGFKINRGDAQAFFPEPASRLPNSVLHNNGNHPDEVADFVGYPSGGQLVSDLADLADAVRGLGARNLNEFVKLQARQAAEAQARYHLGYDVSRENLLNAAREEMVAPEVEGLLAEDLRGFAAANGLPFSREDVEWLAKDTFGQLTVKEAVKPKEFAEQVRRLGNRAEAAIADGNPIKAFQLKQQQLLQYLQMREAFKFQKEFARADKGMRALAKKPVHSKMDQTTRNHLRLIVEQLGYPLRLGKYERPEVPLKGQSLSDFVRGATEDGLPLYETFVPTIGAPGSPVQSIRDLTVDRFRDVDNMVRSLSQYGRDLKTVVLDGKKLALAELEQEVRENATAIGRPYTAGEAQLGKGPLELPTSPEATQRMMRKLAGGLGGFARTLGAATTRPEVPLFWLDRETNGPLMRSIVNPLNAGTYYKAEKIKAFSDAFKEFVKGQPKGWVRSLEARVNVPELTYGRDATGAPVPWLNDKGNVIRAALHFGTEDNFANLVEGFGWDPQVTVDAINREMTAADWKYVQFLWDQVDSLWPEVQALYRDTVGLAPPEVPGRPVPTTTAGTLRGKYWHLDYDWNAVGEFSTEEGNVNVIDPMALGESAMFGPKYRVATPPNGSTKQRTQFRGPLNLDHATLHRELESVLHDLAFRRPLIQAAKVLKQPGVRNAIRESLGPEYLTRFNEWLQNIARSSSYDQTALRGTAAMVRGLRRRFTMVQIGYNVSTLVKHGGIAAMHMTGEAGTHLAGAVGDLLRDGEHWQKFIDENSGEVRNTLFSLDRDIREVMERAFAKNGVMSGWTYHATTMFAVIKRVEAQATWLAKYREIYEGGASHEDAMALADKAVRDTQGSGTVVNLSAYQTGEPGLGGEVLKFFNMFTSFENTATNRAWTMIRRQQRIAETQKRLRGKPNGRGFDGFEDAGDAGARRDSLRNLTHLLAFFVLPIAFLTFASDEVTGKYGQTWLHRLAEHTLQGVIGGTLPGGNTFAEMANVLATKGRDTGGDDPLASMMKAAGGMTSAMWDKLHGKPIADHRWVQHSIDTIGYTMGWPVKPVERAGQFAYDKSNGKIPPGWWNDVRGVLFGSSAVKEHSNSSEQGARYK